MSGPSDTVLFLGRFHPVLVHLPIGLILILAVLEVLGGTKRFGEVRHSRGLLLAMAVPLSIVTALCGWLLSRAGGYEAQLLQRHLVTGIGTASAVSIAALLYRSNQLKAYRLTLFVTVALVGVASHLGGSLTHGSDYLTQYAPQPLRAVLRLPARPARSASSTSAVDPIHQPAFAALVEPLLQDKCVSCHGPEKSKGGLRLDSFAALLKGGEAGPAVIAGNASKTELLRRIRLPLEDEDHMPPDGKPQPSPEEIGVLEWWVAAGASETKTIAELNPPPHILRFVQAKGGTGVTPTGQNPPLGSTPRALAEVAPLAERLSEELNVSISSLSETEPWLQCNAGIAGAEFTDEGLTALGPVSQNLVWLDLAGTRITDTGLTNLSAMPNLTRLHLQRTAITDAGLAALKGLSRLEYLNLYGTAVTDAGLDPLRSLPKLRKLYLWQTRVTSTGAVAFAEARTDHAQLDSWRREIEELQARIRDAQVTVDIGVTNAATVVAAKPINAKCPVSGKDIDPTKTVVCENLTVAFCCDDCKAKFQQDPAKYRPKLRQD